VVFVVSEVVGAVLAVVADVDGTLELDVGLVLAVELGGREVGVTRLVVGAVLSVVGEATAVVGPEG
jgi:hypothetical protein